jgi:hypothetical protein
LELHFDDAGVHVSPDQHQVAAVGLDGRPHEVNDALQLAQALGTFGVTQLNLVNLSLGHPTILPCPNPIVTPEVS